MKNDELYQRIKLTRNNKDNRKNNQYLSYSEKSNRSERLLKNVRKSIKDKVCLKEALVQFIIADVTAFEVYFRDLFHAIYDYCEDEREFLAKCEKLVDKKFDFQDLVIISHDNIKLCDIVVEHQNFQNLNSINKVFSSLIKEHFFDSLYNREFEVRLSENDEYPLATFKLDPDWYEKLDEYLKLRHNLTHDFNPKLRIKPEKIDNLHENLTLVIGAVDTIFYEEILWPYLRKKNIKNPYKIIHNDL
jgi:hypothetical protein